MNNEKKSHAKPVTGIISITSKGVGYIKNPELEEDIEVQNQFLHTALHGDEVEAVLGAKNAYGRQSGEVTKIIRRAKTVFVGTLEKEHGTYFLVPDDKKMYVDIMVTPESVIGANLGEKVLVHMAEWTDQKKGPHGSMVKVLGAKGNNDVEMESIVLERGFDTDYPEAVELEAQNIERNSAELLAKGIASAEFGSVQPRRDVRDVFTCTIDPADAKDFDDALSIRTLDNGNFEVGIHIADVSYYVREKTALDAEARKRAFSVYLVDRTIPMLPHILSNGVCSLNPNEDKLTFSAIFEMNAQGQVLDRWFGRTVMNSDKRFTYEEAQEVLDTEGKSGPHWDKLLPMKKIADKLREEKMRHGAIDFEQDEVKFRLDETGKPIGVYKKPRLDTMKLVEEFMLLANREVAQFIFEKNKKFNRDLAVYRVHDVPDKEKIAELSIFLKALGYDLDTSKKQITPKDIQKILNEVTGDPNEALIKTATIRSMAKAAYSTRNIGHFGLAFTYYTHFTSPIRRYPDLLVHRILQDAIDGKKIDDEHVAYYTRACVESSQREIAAADAERASIKYKQIEYMQSRVGQTFDGIISGVSEWGIYVEEAETRAEGMVKLRDLTDDFYELDAKKYTVIGQAKGKKYTLGDKVRVKLVSADLEKRTLDWNFL
jgi:ribonuclease R